MRKLIQLRDNLKQISNDRLNGVALDVFNDNRDYLIDLNKKQLSEGKNPEGQVIGTYKRSTQLIAQRSNPRQPKIAGQPFNFEWTGSLFDRFTMVFGKTFAIFKSNDSKVAELTRRYGNLFGLSKQNIATANKERLKESAIRKICLKLRIR